MVCNNLITPLPLPLRMKRFEPRSSRDLTGLLLGIRRTATLAILLLGCVCFRLAGEACALVSIGLISFAEVAQFVPAIVAGMPWHALACPGVAATEPALSLACCSLACCLVLVSGFTR